ncbi:MAG: biotin/lipoyl-binding protein, partial [Myxococcales bacterium]|nr:biotin/lipoyl-binding protein [Myxococcales bacterium]
MRAQHDEDSHAKEETHEEHGEEHDEHSEGVKLTPAEIEEFGVELGNAESGVIALYLSLPGEVRPNADRLAHIVPRFSGIVKAVHANLGDRVRSGQALATIESDESLAPFEVETLISGTVIAKHIALGEAVSRDKDI